MSSSTAPTGTANVPNVHRQKRMGPAPFASFEDLSDEVRSHLDSPEDKLAAAGSVVRLPGIREDITPCTPAPSPAIIEPPPPSAASITTNTQFVYTGISLIGAPSTPTMSAPTPSLPPQLPIGTGAHLTTATKVTRQVSLHTPNAPRIDISRASSSSHHDSKESSPERELFDGGQEAHSAKTKVSLGFREDGAVDLRSSTEELDFQETDAKPSTTTKITHKTPRPTSPCPIEESYSSHQRKDSQSSELGLLCISGRTSRLSSIGSQGSAHSRVSTASHLSVISNQSGVSRSPSPHKMLLETSFCGTKPNDLAAKAAQQYGTKAVEPEELERIILKRQHDPTQAILAEGMTAVSGVSSPALTPHMDVKQAKPTPPARGKSKTPPEKPVRRSSEKNQQSYKSEVTITVDKPTSKSEGTTPKLPKTIISASGIEYTYIPLKGPLPEGSDVTTVIPGKMKVRETKSATLNNNSKQKVTSGHSKSKSASPSPVVQRHSTTSPTGPRYIRIKLKPDHMYSQEDRDAPVMEIHKPDSLDLNEDVVKKPAQSFEQIMSTRPQSSASKLLTPAASPKVPPRHVVTSKSPSPSLSRKSSFASLFKNRDGISPETPTQVRRKHSNSLRDDVVERRGSRERPDRDRSLPPSSTESIDSKGKPKSVFSLFKTKTKGASDELPNLENLAIELKTPTKRVSRATHRKHNELEGESIRIPLHSPTYYEQKAFLQPDTKTSSLDSQETVIEAVQRSPAKIVSDSIIEVATVVEQKVVQPVVVDHSATRQSSTSSENIVFSTKLGSSNDIFTTKIPKQQKITENGNVHVERAIVEVNRRQQSDEDKQRQGVGFKRGDEEKQKQQRLKRFDDEEKQQQQRLKRFDDEEKQQRQEGLNRFDEEKQQELKRFNEEKQQRQQGGDEEKLQRENAARKLELKRSMEKEVSVASLKEEKQQQRQPEMKRSIEKEISVASLKELQSQSPTKADISSSSARLIEQEKGETSVGLVTSRSREDMEKMRRSPVEKEICRIKTIEKVEVTKKIHHKIDNNVQEAIIPPFKKDVSPSSSSTKVTKEVVPKVPTTLDLRRSTYEDDYHGSSESEKDSEKDSKLKDSDSVPELQEIIEPERKGLVMQQDDSFEDEFPYIPTTLPQERSVAVPIVPVKQRGATFAMKSTCPIDRPRSTTPINPSCLEEYCEEVGVEIGSAGSGGSVSGAGGEKISISLPRGDNEGEFSRGGERKGKSARSPRRTNSANWFDFSAMGGGGGGSAQIKAEVSEVVSAIEKMVDAPPLPPKGVQKEWINFEEIPERRKPPKRIQTIPSRGHIDVPDSVLQLMKPGGSTAAPSHTHHHHSHHHHHHHRHQQPPPQQVVYTYVNPEDCKCECHEVVAAAAAASAGGTTMQPTTTTAGSSNFPTSSSTVGGGSGNIGGGSSNMGPAEGVQAGDEEEMLHEDELPLLEDDPVSVEEMAPPSVVISGDKMRLEVTVVNRRSVVSDSSIDLSLNVDTNCPEQELQTPFTSDLGVSSNRSSIISQDEPQSPDSQSPNAFTKPT